MYVNCIIGAYSNALLFMNASLTLTVEPKLLSLTSTMISYYASYPQSRLSLEIQ